MRLGCLLIVVEIALLVGGTQGVYTAATNSRPQEYTVARYLQEKPAAKWLRLTNGTLDLSGLNYTSTFGVGRISELYVPLEPSEASQDETVHILIATKDPALLQLAERMRELKTRSDALRFLQEHQQELAVRRSVQGLIRSGIDLEDRDVRKLRSLNKNLAQDFVVVAEGERPDYLMSSMLLLAGLVLGGWLLKQIFGKSTRLPGSQPPPLPPPVNQPPPLPTIR